MKKTQIIVSLFSICIIDLTGCFSSTRIYKQDYRKNDSVFVQRDIGAKVFIFLNNGEESRGEPLKVNYRTLFLSNDYGLTEEELTNSGSNIHAFQNNDIRSLWILGEDNLLIGLGIGLSIGIATLIIAGKQERLEDAFVIGGLGILGAVAGLLIGSATSTYDEEIYNYMNQEDFDFMQLNIYSRYGGKEPEYLEQIK